MFWVSDGLWYVRNERCYGILGGRCSHNYKIGTFTTGFDGTAYILDWKFGYQMHLRIIIHHQAMLELVQILDPRKQQEYH